MPGFGPDPSDGGDTSALALEAGGNLADVKTATETTATETGTMDTAIGTVADAKVDTDATGTLSAKMRGMVSRLASLITSVGSVGAAADADGTIHAQLRYIAENPGSVSTVTANAGTDLNTSALALESGGNLATIAGDTTAMDAAIGATTDAAVSTDTTGTLSGKLRGLVKLFAAAFGSVGAAADVDGVVHGQLRYVGEALDSVIAGLLGLTKTSFTAPNSSVAARIVIAGDSSTAATATLAAGLYEVTTDVDIHIRSHTSAPTAVNTDRPVWAKTYALFYCDATHNVAGINHATGETGVAYFKLLKAD